jgi:hypothetical protein
MAKMKISSVVKAVPAYALALYAQLKEQRAATTSCYEAMKRFENFHRDSMRLHELMIPPRRIKGTWASNFWQEDLMMCDQEEPPPYIAADKFKRDCWARGYEARCKLEAALAEG